MRTQVSRVTSVSPDESGAAQPVSLCWNLLFASVFGSQTESTWGRPPAPGSSRPVEGPFGFRSLSAAGRGPRWSAWGGGSVRLLATTSISGTRSSSVHVGQLVSSTAQAVSMGRTAARLTARFAVDVVAALGVPNLGSPVLSRVRSTCVGRSGRGLYRPAGSRQFTRLMNVIWG